MSTSDRRAALRDKLVALTAATIAEHGLAAVKARPLAAEAGCSVGAIYNVFGDLTDLILAVNGETFKALGAHVQAAIPGGVAPVERLIAMSEAYLAFAQDNPKLWRALFDLQMNAEGDVPEWYLVALDGLFALIDQPVAELYPDLSDEEVRLRTQTLFSAVHGIVLLGIERRISGVGPDRLSDMIRYLLKSVTT